MEALSDQQQRQEIPHLAFITLLKYLDLQQIMTKIVCLSRGSREWAKTENYILYKHFIRYYNLHERHKRYDIPGKTDIFQLIRDSGITSSSLTPAESLTPFCFGTDGGTYNDVPTYFIDKIFAQNNVCHSTKIPKNANLSVYLGKKVDLNLDLAVLKNFKPSNSDPNLFQIPFMESTDPEEEETYKLIKELNIHNQGWGYTCFVSAFAIFVSETKISLKSPVIAAFNNIQSVVDFEAMKFPIKQKLLSDVDQAVQVYEIDQSKQVDIENAVKTSKLDCQPILWVSSKPSQLLFTVKLKQRVVGKYMVIKLIDSYKNNISDNNIDMYNLSLKGNTIKFHLQRNDFNRSCKYYLRFYSHLYLQQLVQ